MTHYSSSDLECASVTCHECGEVSEYHTIEWPPKIFFCVYCESVYSLDGMDKTGRVTWTLVVPEWEDD